MIDPLRCVIASIPLPRAARAVVASAVFIAAITLITLAFYNFHWSWILYAILVAVLFGLLAGFVVLTRVPKNAQVALIGAFTGMAIDLGATASLEGAPTTALNSLAGLVTNTVRSVMGAARRTGLPDPLEVPLAAGLWVFIAVLGLVMLFGLIFEPQNHKEQ